MQTERLELDRTKARELFRDYKRHQHWSTPIDREIQRTYQLIAQGRVVIRALESIKAAGLNEQGLPKLAIIRATQTECIFSGHPNGSGIFSDQRGRWARHSRNRISMPPGTFAFPKTIWHARAIVPMVPVHLRPKRGLANYHILWEADWERIPVDPMLLRRIGKGDLWVVVAAWDLTPVEQAALAARVNA